MTFSATALFSAHGQLVLPDAITIEKPSNAVAAGAAAFSGAWLGAWGSELPTALIVEQIHSNDMAMVMYAWGDLPMDAIKADWSRQAGSVSNGKLRLISEYSQIDFTLEPDGAMQGRYQGASDRKDAWPAFVVLHRVPFTNVLSLRETVRKTFPIWQEVRIPVHSQVGPTKGKTLWLQTTVFHQSIPGKHPVVIVNHGSTGPGIVPASFVFRGGNDVEFFRSLGYVVVAPMRKGRGQSEGPNVEEDSSIPVTNTLESAIEDLHAVVDYVSRQSDMDPARIVLAGASRGGLLSVAYAGRYPTNIVGVINFSGGWFGEGHPSQDFNFEAFRNAGRDARIPMLWLYADHDSVYSLKFDEREFSAFRDAGGRGEFVEFRDIPGEGHYLSQWVDRWQDKVQEYLAQRLNAGR